MVCPYCLHRKTEIYNSRATKKLNQVWRRRRCLTCKKTFTTTETIELSKILKVKTNKITPYHRGKLFSSLLKVCDHRNNQAVAAFYLLEICEEALLKKARDQVVSGEDIANQVATILQRFDVLAWAKYCSYHGISFDKNKLKS